MLGRLVGTLGLEQQLAHTIVAFIMSGGIAVAATAFPIIAPFIGTIGALQAALGAGAVIGF